MRRCPVCGEPAAPRAENPQFPFCKPRCKQIDLSNWLGGDYAITRSLVPEGLSGWPGRGDLT